MYLVSKKKLNDLEFEFINCAIVTSEEGASVLSLCNSNFCLTSVYLFLITQMSEQFNIDVFILTTC